MADILALDEFVMAAALSQKISLKTFMKQKKLRTVNIPEDKKDPTWENTDMA